MIGKTIGGDYEVLAELGRGAYGVVYRCRESSLGKIVAVKMLLADALQRKMLDDFIAEGRRLAALNHPNVIHVHRAGTHEDRPYLVMEYVQGRTLRQLLAESRLPAARALEIMAQVARGLEAIHDAGLVHRDISTNNVMVTDDGTAKILDLGLARFTDGAATISATGRIAGTLYYIAPEVVDGQRADRRSDIFSFGVLLYEALSGVSPFQGEGTKAVLYNILHRDHEPLESRATGLPPRILRLVDHCLQKNPDDRLSGMSGVSGQITESLRQFGGDVVPTASPVATRPIHASRGANSSANPYHNRSMIRHPGEFVGRSQEIRRIYSRLNASPPGCISIVGPRRIGKSSLLNFVGMPVTRDRLLEKPDSMVMVFVDLQEHPDIELEAFLRVLTRTIREAAAERIDLPQCDPTLDGMKDTVQRLCGEKLRLAILFDEFEVVTTNRNFSLEFFSFLRFLANRYDVGYITSSTRDLQVLCHTQEISDSPFFNIFSTMKLSCFSEDEARELIAGPSARAGFPLEDHYDFITRDLAGYFPLFLQIGCSHLFDFLQEETAGPDLDLARRRYYEEVEPHYRYLWSSLDDHERDVIGYVVEHRNVPEPLRDILDNLMHERVVLAGKDRPQVFSSTFEHFLHAETGRVRKRPFWKRLLGRDS